VGSCNVSRLSDVFEKIEIGIEASLAGVGAKPLSASRASATELELLLKGTWKSLQLVGITSSGLTPTVNAL
jgi:hypothetical protein